MRTTSFVPTAHVVRDTGFWLTSVSATAGFLYVAGQTLHDPGGTEAMVAIGSWALPMLVLVFLALLWREAATALLLPGLLVPVALAFWAALDPTGWEQVLTDVGPFGALVVMFLGLGFALVGLHEEETHVAGLAIVFLTVVPAALLLVVAGEIGALSTALASLPVLATGLLYLWAAELHHREDSRAVDEELSQLMPAADHPAPADAR